MSDSIARSQQENILTLLCYDEQHFKFLRNAVALELFNSPYREAARRAYDFIDNYNEPPKDHIGDLLEDLIEGPKTRRIYIRLLENLSSVKDHISAKYTIDQLEKFTRQQNLKAGIIEASEALHDLGSDEDLDEIETVLMSRMKNRLSLFDPGLSLANDSDVFSFFEEGTLESFPTGIPELDRHDLGPIRGGLTLFIGDKKSGKSMWLMNLAKQALLQNKRVVYITLEMSERLCMKRLVQSLCGVTKEEIDTIVVPKFVIDDLGQLEEIELREIHPKLNMKDPDIRKKLEKKISKWKSAKRNLIIKQFPTGQLTIRELNAYLDRLQEVSNFNPDLIIVDYADLMKKDIAKMRESLGQIYIDLRGIAVERDIAFTTATQSNREGAKNKKVSGTTVSEDYSKLATCDTSLVFNKTEFEKKLGLGRITVDAARNDADGFTVAISQNYAMSQFVRDSFMLTGRYDEIVKSLEDDYEMD